MSVNSSSFYFLLGNNGRLVLIAKHKAIKSAVVWNISTKKNKLKNMIFTCAALTNNGLILNTDVHVRECSQSNHMPL